MQIVLKTMHILLWIIGLFAVLISFFLQNYCPAQGRLSGCFLPDRNPMHKICILTLYVGFCLKTRMAYVIISPQFPIRIPL